MDKKVKVSVIIPSYNVAPFIEQCLTSVTNQTLNELEIICVDAHSCDGTLDLILDYTKKDARIKLVLSEKRSYGYQMNLGLAIASGEYIGIVESDDWAADSMFERLYLEAEKHSAEIVKSNYYRYSTRQGMKDEFYEVLKGLPYGNVFHPEKYKNILMLTPSIWTGIYKKSFLDTYGIRFLESAGASFQDTGFMLKCFACASKVLLMKDAFLHYRVDNENSSVKSADKVYCICDEFAEIERFVQERPEVMEKYLRDIWAVRCQRYCWNFYRICGKVKREFLQRMRAEFWEAKKEGLLNQECYDTHNWKFLQMVLADDPSSADSFCSKPLVSVIVFHGCGTDYDACLKSLEQQTLDGTEIIRLEVDYWQAEGTEIKEAVLHANGSYVLFVDQPVEYLADMLERGFKRAFATGADLTVANGRFQFGNSDRLEPNQNYIRTLPEVKGENLFYGCDAPDAVLCFTVPYLCNRLYKKSYLMELPAACFGKNRMTFCYGSLYYASCIAYMNEILLHSKEQVTNMVDLVQRMIGGLEDCSRDFLQFEEFGRYKRSFCISVLDTAALLLEGVCKDCDRIEVIKVLDSSQFLQEILTYEPEYYCHAKIWALRFKGMQRVLQIRNHLEQVKSPTFEMVARADEHEKTAKVSVIIPVYNAEEYLAACLDSICSQTLREIEIICIDDGSNDGSLRMLEEYASQDKRFVIIHQPNYKLSVARNVGVRLSVGEYLFFIDSDDKLDVNALSVLYQKASHDQMDVLYFNSKVFRDSSDAELIRLCASYESFYNRNGCYHEVCSGPELFEKMYQNGDYLSSPCLQFVSRKHFVTKDLWFEPGIYHEDEIYGLKSILRADRAGYLDEKLYERRIRKNSIVSARKELDHAYGRFVCYKRILEILAQSRLNDLARQYGERLTGRMLTSARLNWEQLDEAERFAFYGLPDQDRNEFRVLIHAWSVERSKLTANQKWFQNEKKDRIKLKTELDQLKKTRNQEKQKDQQDRQALEQKHQQDKQNLEQKHQQDRQNLEQKFQREKQAVERQHQQEAGRWKDQYDHTVTWNIRSLLQLARATGKKVALWGCGKIGMEILEKMRREQITVDFLIDQNPELNHQEIYGYIIYAFDEVKDQTDVVLAASHKYFDSIQAMAEDKIVIELAT